MKFQNSCFWIFMCGAYLVCSGAAFGHLGEADLVAAYTPPKQADGGEVTISYMANSFSHPNVDGNSTSADPTDDDWVGYHKHAYMVIWQRGSERKEVPTYGEWEQDESELPPERRLVALTSTPETGYAGRTFRLQVKVVNEYSEKVPGATVSFSGGGMLSPSSSITDDDGVARTNWTLGESGTFTVTASIEG